MILSPELNFYGIPWRHSFFVPVFLYLIAVVIKGIRFGVLFEGSPDKKNSAPYHHALALNNIGPNYLTDAFIFWFYLPYFGKRKILKTIALSRFCDSILLVPAFFYVASLKEGIWSWLFCAVVLWGSVSLVYLLSAGKSAFNKFAPTFALTLLAWLTELAAASIFFYLHRGSEASGFEWGFRNLMDSFIRGPHDAYHWFYLSHFVIAFASLITMSYRKD